MPDSNRIEYGSLIWRDNAGHLHYTTPTAGTNGQWNPPSAPTGNGFNTWSQVVGYIHSHPTEVYQNNQWITVPPESHYELPSSGDWDTADFYIRNGANAFEFSIYISHNGQVREFDLRSNTGESRNRNDQSPGHGIESGDYRPGTTC
jgi:hypothetical protein